VRIVALLFILPLAGCGGDSGGGSDRTADDAASQIEVAVSSVAKTERLTEDTDPNDLLGRPSGYDAATVIYDSRVECSDGPGVDCGATLEQWSTAKEAQDRAEYIEAFGALANEYHYFDGSLLLRVSGELKPSEAKEYETGFGQGD
jgi:hypothetical protein